MTYEQKDRVLICTNANKGSPLEETYQEEKPIHFNMIPLRTIGDSCPSHVSSTSLALWGVRFGQVRSLQMTLHNPIKEGVN